MKIGVKYVNSNGPVISPEEASEQLRGMIRSQMRPGVYNALWLAWKTAMLIIKATMIFILEIVLIFYPFGPVAFAIVFTVINSALLYMFFKDIGRRFPGKRLKGKIKIGRAFPHLTVQHSGREDVAMVGSWGTHYVNYIAEPNPHVLMLGSTSSGKTTTLRSFVSRVSAADKIPFLIIDWHGENEGWAKEVNATLWKVPEHLKVNLFKLNGLSKETRASIAVEGLAVSAHLTALQSTKVKSALLKFYLSGKEPTLFELWEALCGRHAGKGNVLNQRLRGIQRVIGSEPEEFWSRIFTGNNVVSMIGLNENEKALVAYSILQRLTEFFDKEQWQGKGPRLMVVIDEAWQLLRKSHDYDSARESVAEKIVRLGRKYGIGIVISTQQIEDVPKVFLNSCSLMMIHQHRDASYFGRDVLGLNRYEQAYMKNAAQGEMLLFDRGRAQEGAWHSEYVKVEPLSNSEMQALSSDNVMHMPARIEEPEMPIEVNDAGTNPGIAEYSEHKVQQPKRVSLKLPDDLPTPALYAGLLAIYNNPKATLNELIEYIKSRGWFTSPNTLYGSKAKPGIFTNLVAKGMVRKEKKGYRIMESGMKWVDPDMIMANQADKLGSEEHKRLMRKAIQILQEQFRIAIVGREKHSFDILGVPVNAKKPGLWDVSSAKGYEVQTSARSDSVKENAGKAYRYGIPIVWISDNKEVLGILEKITRGQDEYMII